MVGLLSLPTELIIEIFDHLQPVDEVHPLQREYATFDPQSAWQYTNSYGALLNLARTCKLLQPIATECLYKHQWAPYSYPNHMVLRRLQQDAAAGLAIKHIRILQDGPHCRYAGRTRSEIKEHLLQLQLLEHDVRPVLYFEPAQLEVAIMVAHSPNLESLRMKVFHAKSLTPKEKVPVWLRPIVNAGKAYLYRPLGHYAFGRLRTLNIRGQSLCSPDLAYLFCLPRLHRLHISDVIMNTWDSTKRFRWPVKYASSDLQELKVTEVEAPAEIIAHMVRTCKALSLFRCRRVDDHTMIQGDMLLQNTDESRKWCIDILAAVKQHKSSLKFLELQPNDEGLFHEDLFFEYERLDVCQEMQALELLIMPFMLLIGRPSNTAISEIEQPSHAPLRNFLPSSLRQLTLIMHPLTAPLVTDEAILSCIPPDSDATDAPSTSFVQEVNIVYGREFQYATLPLNFWQIKHDFRLRGVQCNYTLPYCIDYATVNDGSFDKEHVEMVTEELSTHGLKGLEMAQHFGDVSEELEARLYKLLGLDEDKVLTKEERDIMFMDDGKDGGVDNTGIRSLRDLADRLYGRTR